MFGQGVGGDSYLKFLSWHHFEDGQVVYIDDFSASSNFAFASMMLKYYHFVFETTCLFIHYCVLIVDLHLAGGS